MATIIYVNSADRVVSVNKPVEGCRAIDVTEDESFCKISDTAKLCYCYKEPGTFWLVVNSDIVRMLEDKQAEIDNLNETVNTLILSSLEGSDV